MFENADDLVTGKSVLLHGERPRMKLQKNSILTVKASVLVVRLERAFASNVLNVSKIPFKNVELLARIWHFVCLPPIAVTLDLIADRPHRIRRDSFRLSID